MPLSFTLQNRKIILKEQLQNHFENPSTISPEEMDKVLDSKIKNNNFPKHISNQIYKKLSNPFDLQDFIQRYIQAEETLEIRRQKLDKQVQQLNQNYQKELVKFKQSKNQQIKKSKYFQQNFHVRIEQIKFQNLFQQSRQKFINPYIIISLGQNQYKTVTLFDQKTVFNLKVCLYLFFIRDAHSSDQILVFKVYNKLKKQNQYIGIGQIELSQLMHGKLTQNLIPLYYNEETPLESSLLVKMVLISSRAQFHENQLNQIKNQLGPKLTKIDDIQQTKQILKSPFEDYKKLFKNQYSLPVALKQNRQSRIKSISNNPLSKSVIGQNPNIIWESQQQKQPGLTQKQSVSSLFILIGLWIWISCATLAQLGQVYQKSYDVLMFYQLALILFIYGVFQLNKLTNRKVIFIIIALVINICYDIISMSLSQQIHVGWQGKSFQVGWLIAWSIICLIPKFIVLIGILKVVFC